MNVTIVVIGLVVILILATLLWSSRKRGSIGWKWKNALIGEVDVSANQDQEIHNIEQIQDGGEGNKMSSSSPSCSRQLQKGGKNNHMEIK